MAKDAKTATIDEDGIAGIQDPGDSPAGVMNAGKREEPPGKEDVPFF